MKTLAIHITESFQVHENVSDLQKVADYLNANNTIYSGSKIVTRILDDAIEIAASSNFYWGPEETAKRFADSWLVNGETGKKIKDALNIEFEKVWHNYSDNAKQIKGMDKWYWRNNLRLSLMTVKLKIKK